MSLSSTDFAWTCSRQEVLAGWSLPDPSHQLWLWGGGGAHLVPCCDGCGTSSSLHYSGHFVSSSIVSLQPCSMLMYCLYLRMFNLYPYSPLCQYNSLHILTSLHVCNTYSTLFLCSSYSFSNALIASLFPTKLFLSWEYLTHVSYLENRLFCWIQ